MNLSDDARKYLGWLREEYIKAEHPSRRRWGIVSKAENRAVLRELHAHCIIEPHTRSDWILTDVGLDVLLNPPDSGSNAGINLHHHGDVIMGTKYTSTITGSTVGAFAQGDHAVATGTVNLGAAGPLTQEQHKAAIKEAQTALVHDQDALERIDDRLYEALNQFLTMARKIQVDQQSLADVQAKMKETLDEVWAQQAAKGLRPQALPEGLKVVGELSKSPAMTEVLKKLLGA